MIDKMLKLISLITFGLTAILFALVSYWTFYPYEILKINNLDGQGAAIPNKHIYCAGEVVKFNVDYTKMMPIRATFYSALVDTITISYPVEEMNFPVGTNTTIVERRLPTFITHGTYYMTFTLDYQVNPLRKITYSYTTQKFHVDDCVK